MKSLKRSSANAVRGEKHAHDKLEGVCAVVTGVEQDTDNNNNDLYLS
jgi:hypothetical protein